MQRPILLFDLGGVLVDLADPAKSIGLQMTTEEFWAVWLNSPLVREFETGRLSRRQFAEGLGAQLGFASGAAFDAALRRWHLPMFDGVENSLRELTSTHAVALLSNTNEIHWQHVAGQSDVFDGFERLFLSYETGNAKPDPAAFHDVIEHFGCDPVDILFFDDSPGNVAAARQAGLQAVRVRGWAETAGELAKRL